MDKLDQVYDELIGTKPIENKLITHQKTPTNIIKSQNAFNQLGFEKLASHYTDQSCLPTGKYANQFDDIIDEEVEERVVEVKYPEPEMTEEELEEIL